MSSLPNINNAPADGITGTIEDVLMIHVNQKHPHVLANVPGLSLMHTPGSSGDGAVAKY